MSTNNRAIKLTTVELPQDPTPTATRFFHYHQNNSGGHFQVDDNVTYNVIIEAHNARHADEIAESIGLYFDGEGDCECCGNRWYPALGDGTKVPSVYNKPIDASYNPAYVWGNPHAYIYMLNGEKVRVDVVENRSVKA